MPAFRAFLFSAALALPVLLASCSSKPARGLPRNLPVINAYGSPQTPPHSMERKDYPFDSNGNYVTAWAAEGDAAASTSDYSRWQSSHGGSVSRRKLSPVRKVASPSRGKKSTASVSSGRVYTVRKGDTLSTIARRHGTTVAKLKAANGLSSDIIRVGRALKIPR
jgi:LysM repeat protein